MENIHELHYPPHSLILIAGLPGAGKTTLLTRIFQLTDIDAHPKVVEGTHVIDSQQSRQWWASRLNFLPDRLRTPFTQATHVWRIARAVLGRQNVVAHTRGTWAHILYGFAVLTNFRRMQLHVILIDVPPPTALAGQRARGRSVTRANFKRHCRRWHILLDRARRNKLPAASVTIMDRETANQLLSIEFKQCEYAVQR